MPLRSSLAFLSVAGLLLWTAGQSLADPMSDGQCREDPAATQSLGQAIHCHLSGWDDFVSCADPEAAPDRCDSDDPVSRALRRASGDPLFRTRAEARARCAAKVAELRVYGITETDIASFGSPVVYQCPDAKPHARAMVPLRDGVWFCRSCGTWMRLPEHTFFSVSVWGARDISREEAMRPDRCPILPFCEVRRPFFD
jgi:hypothetical protein